MKKTTVAPDPMTPQTGAPVMSAAMMPATTRPPLWLQVARWCLGCKIPVNRQLIAQAFAIPERQAADIMLYITGRRADVVQARRKVAVMPGGMREATLEVLSIREEAMPLRGAASHQSPRRPRAEAPSPAALRDLVLGRRRPGGAA